MSRLTNVRSTGGIAALACSIAAISACGGEPANDHGSYTTADSAGIEIVESISPTWPGGTRRLDPEPLLQIGEEKRGPYQFSFIPFGIPGADGGFVVAELDAQELRAFDSSGRHVASFGGRGSGPDEFRGLGGVYRYRGDSIAVYDGRLNRITILDAGLSSHRDFTYQVPGNYGVFGVAEDSIFMLYSPGGSYRPDLQPGLQWVTTDIIAMGPEGGQQVVGRLPDRLRRVAPDGNAPMPQPLQYAIHAGAAAGFYWARSDRYEVRLYSSDGTLRRVVRRPVEPRPVEPEMIEQLVERQLERVRRAQGENAVPEYRQRLEEDQYGEWLPLFSRALVDGDQRLWIAQSTWPSNEPAERWSIFSPEGYFLGDVDVSGRLTPLDSRGDRVLVVRLDEFDVPHLQVRRLAGR